MEIGEVLAVVVITAAVAALFAVLGTRRRLQRRLFRGTGLEEWRQAADRLSWRDRWKVMRANVMGRATEPRLARLAIQRAEAMIAASDVSMRRHIARWLFAVGAVLSAVSVVMQGASSVSDGVFWQVSSMLGLQLVAVIIFAYLALFWRRIHRRDRRRLGRSIAQNTELVNGSSQETEADGD